MRNQQGKVNFTSIILLVLILYGAFVAFKFITAHITKGQIKNDVINRFGYVRGPDFSEEQGEKIIREVLVNHGVLTSAAENEGDESGESQTGSGSEPGPENAEGKTGQKVIYDVRLDENKQNIKIYIRYEEVVDLIIFKSRQTFDIQEEMQNYN
jgi:hypothetical protein